MCYQTIINLLNSRTELTKRLDIADGSNETHQEDEQAESSQKEEDQYDLFAQLQDQIKEAGAKQKEALEYPGSSEHESNKEWSPSQIRQALKRVKSGQITIDDVYEPKTKHAKLGTVESLYEDYKAKRAAARNAENAWRAARNTIPFMLTPKSEKEQVN